MAGGSRFVVAGAAELQDFCDRVLLALGTDAEIAGEVARHLVAANLAGHDSHGVLRLAQYVEEADQGDLVPAARPLLIRESGVTALFDAQRGLGHFSTMAAAVWVSARAREQGLAAAAVRHSMHIGRLGHYAERITEAGLLALVTVGMAGTGAGTVAPFNGAARFQGTNPWCLAVPAAGRPPMIYDAATSTIAEGKVRMARAQSVQVPAGTVRDAAGNPTLDPAQLYAGGSQTVLGGEVAGHKGWGLSLAAALFGGLAMIADEAPSAAGTGRLPAPGVPALAGVFVAAVDPAAFGDALQYQRQVAEVLAAVGHVQPVPGVTRVLVPGDPERSTRAARERDGIPVPASIWEELAGLGERFGVPMPRA